MTERSNLPELVDGRMPTAKDECLLEISAFDALQLSIGDRLAVAPVREGQCTYLLDSGFTVVGGDTVLRGHSVLFIKAERV